MKTFTITINEYQRAIIEKALNETLFKNIYSEANYETGHPLRNIEDSEHDTAFTLSELIRVQTAENMLGVIANEDHELGACENGLTL